MRVLLLVGLALTGCASARQQAENDLADCVNRVELDEMHGQITVEEARTLHQGCAAIFYLRTQGARRR